MIYLDKSKYIGIDKCRREVLNKNMKTTEKTVKETGIGYMDIYST